MRILKGMTIKYQLHCVLDLQRGQPGLATCRCMQRHCVALQRWLIHQAATCTLRISDPDQLITIDHGQPHIFRARRSTPIKQRLTNIRDSRGVVKTLTEDSQPHGQSIVTRLHILLNPALFHQRRQQAVHATFWQAKNLSYRAERKLGRTF